MSKTRLAGRTLVCLAAVLLASGANAGPMLLPAHAVSQESTFYKNVMPSFPAASPHQLDVKIFSSRLPDQPFLWNIGLVTTGDAGTTWRLDATTANSFGFDWAALEESVKFSHVGPALWLTTQIYYAGWKIGDLGPPGPQNGDFGVYGRNGIELYWIELSLSKLQFGAISGDTQLLKIATKRTISSAIFNAPEPSSALLFVIGLLLLHQYAPNCRR